MFVRYYYGDVIRVFHGFNFVKLIHNPDARQKDHLYIPILKNKRSENIITYRGPVIWNQIQKASIGLLTSEDIL